MTKSLSLLALLCAAVPGQAPGQAPAQEPERVVVPARNSARPRVVTASVMHGKITVKAHDGKDVIVESTGSGGWSRRKDTTPPPDGLKRLEIPGRGGLEIEEEDNHISVKTRLTGDLTITVPVDTSLRLKGLNGGPISVDGVNGEIEVSNLNGGIVLTNVSGSVIAHSLNGAIAASMSRVDPAKQLSFSTLNGRIDVTLPGDLKANLKLKSDNGDVFTDFDVKFGSGAPKPVTESSGGNKGRYRVRYEKTIYGTINGGGAEISLQTFNGRISLRKKP
jgi:hypothetical protein